MARTFTQEQKNQGDAAIAACVVATGAMGITPAFIDVAAVVAANSGMLAAMAAIYRYDWSGEKSSRFIRRLVEAGAITIGSVKLLAAGLQLTGIGYGAGATINGIMNALVSLAVGKAAKFYFESDGEASDDQVNSIFLNYLSLGSFDEVRKMLNSKH